MRTSKLWQAAMITMLVALLAAPLVEAQGRGRNRQDGHNFDPGTVITVTGAVEEVLLNTGKAGAAGMHLLLNVEGEAIEARLGPTFYLFPNGLEVEKGDRVTVTGSKVVIDDQPAFIASEIVKGDFVLALRDEAGMPAWRGEGPRAVEGGKGKGRGPRAGEAGQGNGRGPRSSEAGEGNGAGRRGGYGRGMGQASEGSDEVAKGHHRRCGRGRNDGGGGQARNGLRDGTGPRVAGR